MSGICALSAHKVGHGSRVGHRTSDRCTEAGSLQVG
eukprot:CAMPEP_0115516156 /NCGR_PEP_ID=MMETSP0271-20121206/76612_1 /TAXON_ID=71861 /ORGANISM="Scrippsiella trochoidea, Strain CCMP3099" /LENGTH=35 /DNA_ID= /DNA_START= /DNA_END= /DNA_ORIENTATION=